MGNNNAGQAVELANRILEIIEGETTDVLMDINKMLNFYMAYRAEIVDGSEKFNEILNKP